jgi:hypothetical protein
MRKLMLLLLLATLVAGCSPPPKIERVRHDENYPNAEGVTYGYIFSNLPGVAVHLSSAFEHMGKDKRALGRIITEVHQSGDAHLVISFSYGRKSKLDFSDAVDVKPLSLEQKGDVAEATLVKSRPDGDVISRYVLYVPRSTYRRSSAANLFIMYMEPLSSGFPYETWGPMLTLEQKQYLQEFVDRSDGAFSLKTLHEEW